MAQLRFRITGPTQAAQNLTKRSPSSRACNGPRKWPTWCRAWMTRIPVPWAWPRTRRARVVELIVETEDDRR